MSRKSYWRYKSDKRGRLLLLFTFDLWQFSSEIYSYHKDFLCQKSLLDMFRSQCALIQYHLIHIAATPAILWWLDSSNESDPPTRRVTAVTCFTTSAQLLATIIYLVAKKKHTRHDYQKSNFLINLSSLYEPLLVVISSAILFHVFIVLFGGPLIE